MIATDKVHCYAVGICNASVCAPAEMPVEEVAAALNRQHPTGLDHSWLLSGDETFADGEPHPKPCESDASRMHYLFHC